MVSVLKININKSATAAEVRNYPVCHASIDVT